MVYGTDVIFLASLVAQVMNFIQEQGTKSNPIQRRINQLVEVKQIREQVLGKAQIFQALWKEILTERLSQMISSKAI